MEKLAIFGGTPIRTNKIGYGRQWIDNEDIKAVMVKPIPITSR